jgi:DNA-binding transcriptional regulator PaaX
MNKIREKILLLLLGGIAFGYCITPQRQWRVLKTVSKEWKRINEKEIKNGIRYLYKLKLIDRDTNRNDDGSVAVLLTKKGKLKALEYQLINIKNKKEQWDKKWRMVAFDIPEKYKKGRNALRNKLKKIGFCKLQKSIFITPFDCEKEMRILIDFFDLGEYVRFGVFESVDNEIYFKKIFKLA